MTTPDPATPPTLPPNRGGRPRHPAGGSKISTYLRPRDHDTLVRLARRADVSVADIIRRKLGFSL